MNPLQTSFPVRNQEYVFDLLYFIRILAFGDKNVLLQLMSSLFKRSLRTQTYFRRRQTTAGNRSAFAG